ncbi:MAG: hypothetical protein KGL39_40235 [Patescibacteria group bacterium]|nr:hypothetical protein [Patescibacteria group bacterium]
MTQDLKQYLKDNPPSGVFVPRPHYFQEGDYVSYYSTPERAYTESVSCFLDQFKTMDSHEPAGCKIMCVRGILEQLGTFGITVEGDKIPLGWLFIGMCLLLSQEQEIYEQFARMCGTVVIDGGELRKALEKP